MRFCIYDAQVGLRWDVTAPDGGRRIGRRWLRRGRRRRRRGRGRGCGRVVLRLADERLRVSCRGEPLEVFKMGKEYDKFWKPWMHAGGCRVLLYRAFDQSAWNNLVNHNNRDFRLVHVVKDPLQLTLDGYLYHLYHFLSKELKMKIIEQ